MGKPKVKLDSVKIPNFTGEPINYPDFKRTFTALTGDQGLRDEVLMIYIRDAIPKEVRFLLNGVHDLKTAWTCLDDRFGDNQQRLRALYARLVGLEIKGKDFERIERLYLEVEHVCQMVSKEAAKSLFGGDLYIVSTLLAKLSPHQVEKWIEFAENQNDEVESGKNEWEVFRAWLLQGYRLAKRARISVTPSPRQQGPM